MSVKPSPSIQRLFDVVKEGNSALLQEVLSEPRSDVFNIDSQDIPAKNGVTALHYAAYKGHLDCLKLLLQAKVSVDAVDLENATPLHHAAFAGHLQCLKEILAAGADPQHVDRDHCTALHKAAYNGHVDCLAALLEAGCNPDTVDSEEVSALQKCAFAGQIDCLKKLVQSNADLHSVDKRKSTALHKAAYCGHFECVKELVDNGGNVNAIDAEGTSVVHTAAFEGHEMCLEYLLQHGATTSINQKTRTQESTALHFAAFKGRTRCVSLLCTYGAEVDARDLLQMTPLHHAVRKLQHACVEKLLQSGAQKESKDHRGRIPADMIELTSIESKKILQLLGKDTSDFNAAAGNSQDQEWVNASLNVELYRKIDRYGFVVHEGEDSKGMSAEDLQKESVRAMKWNRMFQNWDKTKHSRKLKDRCQKGIPDCVRGMAWKLLTNSVELQLLFSNQNTYQACLDGSPKEAVEILRDIHRTFPRHIYFSDAGEGQRALFNVLKAYAVYNPEIGYCQGMGFISALLLMYMAEEDAFYVLINLCKNYKLAGLWLPTLPRLGECTYVLEKLLKAHIPRVSKHLVSQASAMDLEGSFLSMVVPPWFITVFLSSLPFHMSLRVWDIFMLEGDTIIYGTALALFKLLEEQILALEGEELMPFLQLNSSNSKSIDAEELIRTAVNFKITEKKVTQLEKEYQQQQQQPVGV